MKRGLSKGAPGWLALNLMKGGETVGLCMLATALLVTDVADDHEIAEVFGHLADSRDPMVDLIGTWDQVLEDHPWMQGHMDPLIGWLDPGADQYHDTIRELARFLSGVSVIGCMEWAEDDLLFRVLAEMRTIQGRQMAWGQWTTYTVEQAMMKVLLGGDEMVDPKTGKVMSGPQEIVQSGGRFGDLWAMSGVRAIAMARLMHLTGQDPTTVTWVLQNSDAMITSICAVNMVFWDMGENVHLITDRRYQDSWMAAKASHQAPGLIWESRPKGRLSGGLDLPPAELMEPLW